MLLKSKESKVVFVAFTQYCIQSYSICYSCQKGWKCTLYTVASRPCQEGRLLCELPSWEFSCSPLVSPRRQLCLVSWTCQLQGWLQARRTANPQFLKLKGTQQPGILTNLWQSCILHTLTEPAINVEFRALQCLKCGGLWSSLLIGRLRCFHSSLMWAIRCANLEHSTLNAGVLTDPHSPESNSSYLALIWSVKKLYSLWASCTVIKKTGFGMTDQLIE